MLFNFPAEPARNRRSPAAPAAAPTATARAASPAAAPVAADRPSAAWPGPPGCAPSPSNSSSGLRSSACMPVSVSRRTARSVSGGLPRMTAARKANGPSSHQRSRSPSRTLSMLPPASPVLLSEGIAHEVLDGGEHSGDHVGILSLRLGRRHVFEQQPGLAVDQEEVLDAEHHRVLEHHIREGASAAVRLEAPLQPAPRQAVFERLVEALQRPVQRLGDGPANRRSDERVDDPDQGAGILADRHSGGALQPAQEPRRAPSRVSARAKARASTALMASANCCGSSSFCCRAASAARSCSSRRLRSASSRGSPSSRLGSTGARSRLTLRATSSRRPARR